MTRERLQRPGSHVHGGRSGLRATAGLTNPSFDFCKQRDFKLLVKEEGDHYFTSQGPYQESRGSVNVNYPAQTQTLPFSMSLFPKCLSSLLSGSTAPALHSGQHMIDI